VVAFRSEALGDSALDSEGGTGQLTMGLDTRGQSVCPVCKHSKKVAICKPGKEPSAKPVHTGTLTLDF
jgi:hypothetical protein